MPDFEHFRFSYASMNPLLGENAYLVQQQQHNQMGSNSDSSMTGLDSYGAPDSGFILGEHTGFGQDGLSGLEFSALPPSGLGYLHLNNMHRAPPPPAAMALRNDLGSNISVLKTLNLRFRCFLAKVHELERRNKALEKQLQQALENNEDNSGEGHRKKPLTKEMGVQTGFVGSIAVRPGHIPLQNVNNSAYLPGGLLSPSLNRPTTPVFESNSKSVFRNSTLTDSNCNLNSNQLTPHISISPLLTPTDPCETISNINEKYFRFGTGMSTNPPPRFIPGAVWSYNHDRRFGAGRDSRITGTGVPCAQTDGVGVQIDTITPEIRALYNVLGKVKRERDEYKRRWEEEYTFRVDLQEKVAELEEDLQESEVCQDELALRVKQLKAELVLFKGLMSNNLSDLDSKIQEKAMKVDMDICRRIDITARLCDVAQQRNCEDMIQIFQQMATPPSTLNRRPRKQAAQSVKGGDGDEPTSISESERGNDEESCSTSANQINEEMQRMLNQLRECEFEDDCDSLAWEETEETLLLWEDFPGYTLGAVETQGEQEESIEKVIKDTESLFQTREKEYQETIDQIEEISPSHYCGNGRL
ncbi:non-homologous end joining factor IFFO1-like isoform X7 [Oncorhynchus keta]|uniref:non-homologous end joining factor IFFO1-like isoform X7 n=1 Tax=Oncorhynchus keta TaxID=8018 RepID=UPI0015FD0C9B|nr:non-homologous end joining factor IFFO1-like isoform X7 [Oncorhynchus keta]